MAKRHEHIYQLTQDWIAWSQSRKYYTKRGVKCVLAKLQPFTGDPQFVADGFLSPEVSAFNLAVSSIEDVRLIPFAVIYCEIKPKSITELASEYGVSRYKFYELAHEMALEIFSHTQKILEDDASK